jgi:hypothetical protein
MTTPTPTNSGATSPAVKTSLALVNAFNTILRWIDANVAPIFALVLLCGLAAIGFSTFLEHLDQAWKIGTSIALVAFLAVKTYNK